MMRLVRSLVIIYAIVCAYVFFTSDGKIFLPPAPSYTQLPGLSSVSTVNNNQLSVVAIDNPAANYTVLYSHGNAEDLGQIYPTLELLHSTGAAIVSYDYSGYGLSTGSPSEQQSYKDIEAVYQYMTEQLRIPSDRIIVHGRSVGGGPSAYLASRHPVGGLILESTFTSAFRVVLPFPLFPFDKFPNLRRVDNVTCPVLVIHGDADEMIPIHHGKALYDKAPEPKQSVWIAGADHNNVPWFEQETYKNAIAEFIANLS